ncbi:MAG: transposase [Myxococcales bacterium]|nr:transposase [Myxococcales bacterium]
MASGALPAPHLHGPSGRGEEPAYARRRPEESVLYGVVQKELETFLARAQARERLVPRFVERELRGFLRCGILAHGFVRVHCDGCGLDRVVAFSCKGRGFCPSCGGRRMADTAAHLVDRVLPEVPVRQWVLSLPFALRYRLAYDAPLTSAVLGVFVRTVFASLRRRARKKWGVTRGHCGAVTFVQRFGDALNLNVHFHSLLLDGVYAPGRDGALCFRPLPPPPNAEVARVVSQVARRIARLLERRGLGPEADPREADPLAEEQPLLAQLYGASVAGRIATGRRAGQRVVRMGDYIDPEDLPALQGERCASASGVSLHANVAVPARDRQRLERLCRYVARPPVATERLSRLEDGRLLYRLKHRWRDGTTHVVFEPQELVEKLAALVPPPRFHLVRYHGILGPCASERDRIVPGSATAAGRDRPTRLPPAVASIAEPPSANARAERKQVPNGDSHREAAHAGSRTLPALAAPSDASASPDGTTPRARRLAWSELLRRVFAVDVLECPRCGGRMRVLAAIHPPDATQAILECLDLPSRAPPRAAALPEGADGSHDDFDAAV